MASEAVWQTDAAVLADRISTLLTVVRSAEAEIGALLVESETRGVMELFGYHSVARLLEHLADVPKSAAETMVKRARVPPPRPSRRQHSRFGSCHRRCCRGGSPE